MGSDIGGHLIDSLKLENDTMKEEVFWDFKHVDWIIDKLFKISGNYLSPAGGGEQISQQTYIVEGLRYSTYTPIHFLEWEWSWVGLLESNWIVLAGGLSHDQASPLDIRELEVASERPRGGEGSTNKSRVI